MRVVMMVAACIVCGAAPSLAQSERAYVNVGGGMAIAPDTTSGDVLGEVGVRVARNLFVFGDLGQFHNLQPSLAQPAVDAAALALSDQGLSVTGTARVPAWQMLGGVRYVVPTRGAAMPYVLGGAGLARLSPSAQFIYQSGTLTGVTAVPGDDVASQLSAIGAYTDPAATNAFMFTVGGGVQVPIAPRVSVDVGYRLSRINGDTPVNAHSIVAGVGYHF
ncbi:MAG TPA: porin family protein [Vicinamibacterales bacterium]|nr:porin family protein [Vicinamibacterales bacterium]